MKNYDFKVFLSELFSLQRIAGFLIAFFAIFFLPYSHQMDWEVTAATRTVGGLPMIVFIIAYGIVALGIVLGALEKAAVNKPEGTDKD